MARPLRIEFAGALYHVTSRGDRQEDIVESNGDRHCFINHLGDICDERNWICHAYCLMDNHYHLLIETLDANLSRGMRQLNGIYAQRFNQTHNRVGHVFQGRYKAIHVEKENYLLELSRYIVLNPVRARMVRKAIDWPWSSYRAIVGAVKSPQWLNTDWTLSAFGEIKRDAVSRYTEFVAAGKNQPAPWEALRNQVFLGSDSFVEKTIALYDGGINISEVPRAQRRRAPKSLAEYASSEDSRNGAIHQAFQSGGYSQKEIGEYFGLHYATISKILKQARCKT